ncbi:hypothetical protein BC830DRAFT_1174603, partial [Chytriomyces sp. MP71]
LDTATFKTRTQLADSSSDNDSDNQEGTAREEPGARNDAKRTHDDTDVKAAAKTAKKDKKERKEKKEKRSRKGKKDMKEKKAKKARRHD